MQEEDNKLQQPSSNENALLQANIERVYSKRLAWASLGYAEKLAFLEGMLHRLRSVPHEDWGRTSAQVQGFSASNPGGDIVAAVEQYVNASMISGLIRSLIRTYKSLASDGSAPSPKNILHRDGRWISQVFPLDHQDKLGPNGLAGIKVEVHSTADGGDLPMRFQIVAFGVAAALCMN